MKFMITDPSIIFLDYAGSIWDEKIPDEHPRYLAIIYRLSTIKMPLTLKTRRHDHNASAKAVHYFAIQYSPQHFETYRSLGLNVVRTLCNAFSGCMNAIKFQTSCRAELLY